MTAYNSMYAHTDVALKNYLLIIYYADICCHELFHHVFPRFISSSIDYASFLSLVSIDNSRLAISLPLMTGPHAGYPMLLSDFAAHIVDKAPFKRCCQKLPYKCARATGHTTYAQN